MPRKDRRVDPGSIHHVVNRGLANRTLFETRRDRCHFLALLACAVYRGELRILEYALLTTHFHILVQSKDGQLARSMQAIQTKYSRYFNRARNRDGPLVKGRFLSRRVDSSEYLLAARHYIQQNPVEAGLADSARDFEFCSAATRSLPVVPIWLDPGPTTARQPASASDYRALSFVIERRLGRSEPQDADELADSTPAEVLEWMHERTRLGDGTIPGLPVCDPATVLMVVEERLHDVVSLPRPKRSPQRTRIRSMRCGLLRQLTGLTQSEIAGWAQVSRSSAAASVHTHERLLLAEETYARLASELAHMSLNRGPLASNNWKGEPDVELRVEYD